jgi:hypothetical protein
MVHGRTGIDPESYADENWGKDEATVEIALTLIWRIIVSFPEFHLNHLHDEYGLDQKHFPFHHLSQS